MSTVRQALQSALGANGGAIPFDEFMDIALHHPEDGYYTGNARAIGARGDFTTIPQLTPRLGEAIGRWLREEANRRGWKRFNVIECGPGSGALASSVVAGFGWLGRRKISLHLVETSRPLRERQRKSVRGTWHSDIGQAIAACGGEALIYHNEFFDAFPCRVFRKETEGWTEWHLEVADGRLKGVFLPPRRPLPASTVFAESWQAGQRVEVFASVREWMRALGATWKSGAMMTIDYGGATGELYRRRIAGTLRAYREQRRLAGDEVCQMPGRQDITADVNFDDLRAWGREVGWSASPVRVLGTLLPGLEAADAFRCLVFSANPQDRR